MLKGRKCEQLHMKYKSYIDFIFVVCFKTPYLAILTQTYYSMTSLNFIVLVDKFHTEKSKGEEPFYKYPHLYHFH